MIPTRQDTEEGTGLFPGTSTNDQDVTRQRRETQEAFWGVGGEPGRGSRDGEIHTYMTCSGTFRWVWWQMLKIWLSDKEKILNF